jgi:hypothetical protein
MKTIYILLSVSLLVSCNRKSDESFKAESTQDYAHTDSVSSNTGFLITQPGLSFKYSGNLKFRVKNALRSGAEIERIVRKNKGFITRNQLTRRPLSDIEKPFREDSVLRIQQFQMENSMVIRLPIQSMDTALSEILAQAELMDEKFLLAENVTPELIMEQYQKSNYSERKDRVKGILRLQKGKTGDLLKADEVLQENEMNAISAYGEKANMDYNVRFCEITLQIYEPAAVFTEKIVDFNYLEQVDPGFMYKLTDAFKTGWSIVTGLFLVFVRIWPVLIIVFVIFRFRNRIFAQFAAKAKV